MHKLISLLHYLVILKNLILKFPDFYISEIDLASMILKQNMPLLFLTEIIDLFKFTLFQLLIKCFSTSFVTQYLPAIEPVLYLVLMRNDPAGMKT